ncbi:hypothetical protein LTR70_001004 [Exophiala xenobiotica]|uniref:Uncharacterized protein n=1 Tax=Lithohypha guttulata TaxID=1690604 RepID=A0ABR0KN12_9EURO|nr:hypothetical protein LTR24_000806 [Lithohypha guttulata]KAK5328850.1 hypothetical protein LTR70_001004 [Exophiala xenobiotica]
MKAKRSKRFRKIMHTYQLHYSFREPYQFFENTLHGKVMPYITQCTLAKVMEGYSGRGRDGRPAYLPPPTEIPLRYCKHKDAEGQERGVVPEAECILDMISGQVKGNEQRKNKNHYILAAADWDQGIKDQKEREKLDGQRRRRMRMGQPDVDVRNHARMIPGVPIIYVKKSVMELEQPSVATERAIRGLEKEKFRDGIGGATRGVKRGREDDESEQEDDKSGPTKARRLQKAKAPNPMSVKRKKPKTEQDDIKSEPFEAQDQAQSENASSGKQKRRRGKRGKGGGQVQGAT